MRFDLAAWQAMRVFAPKEDWDWPGDGFYRASVKGKPIVGYVAPVDSGETDFAVRPIVRVKMGRRVEPVRCPRCGSRGMERYCNSCALRGALNANNQQDFIV